MCCNQAFHLFPLKCRGEFIAIDWSENFRGIDTAEEDVINKRLRIFSSSQAQWFLEAGGLNPLN